MVDFWRWEYNYGHNLDSHAAIVVPGMSYQPPLLGYKQLLNFAAFSIPNIGGWIFLGCGGLMLFGFVIEWRHGVKLKKGLTMTVALFAILFLNSCKSGPEAIKTGVDNCAYCKMTISDPRFGAELVTATGKVYKFDDIICLGSFIDKMEPNVKKRSSVYLTDFCGNHELIPSDKGILLQSDHLKCPMDGYLAAFSNADSMEHVKKTFPGEKIAWTMR